VKGFLNEEGLRNCNGIFAERIIYTITRSEKKRKKK
jgi:hypothetical protein